MPFTDGGHTMPVGWNCTNSMFSSVDPARRASACPSPVYSQEFEVTLNDLSDAARRQHDGRCARTA